MASGRASFLEKFFKNIGQENLIQRFFSQGYETIFDMVLITDEDLEHNLLVGDGGVRQLIISAGKSDIAQPKYKQENSYFTALKKIKENAIFFSLSSTNFAVSSDIWNLPLCSDIR